jgi:hypothetical protein
MTEKEILSELKELIESQGDKARIRELFLLLFEAWGLDL